jgi:L-aspartate oxidase
VVNLYIIPYICSKCRKAEGLTNKTIRTDFLIIGSGAAGLSAALHASQYGGVLLLTKSDCNMSSSYRAQGGIAAVLQDTDSFLSHKRDTMEAGREFCDTKAVDLLVKEGACEIQRYIDLGMNFDRTNGGFDLGLEGGHSNRRVLHANGAATGRALIEFLSRLVKAEPDIKIREHAFVYKLISNGKRCLGAASYQYETNEILQIQSPVTVLATGGYAGLFGRSTNPHTSTGDGAWLARKAGAELKDLEFVQFHPTAFYDEDGDSFLVSEAVRGEGARLYNQNGDRFMAEYEQQELAPRDMVAGEIFHQIQQQQNDYVYLDVRHLDTVKVRTRFPEIFARIKKHRININEEGIPVAPAAHYCIGGISTDLNGKTSVEGLYACGEAAATGVHGANRLASNSLLECLVFSKRAINHALGEGCSSYYFEPGRFNFQNDFSYREEYANDFNLLQQKIASLLMQHAGIYRDRQGLQNALIKLYEFFDQFSGVKDEYFSIRAEGLLQLTEMIIKAALQREESRGVHIRSDFPGTEVTPEHILF